MKSTTKAIIINKLQDEARKARDRVALARNSAEKEIFHAKANAYLDACTIVKKQAEADEAFCEGMSHEQI